MEKYIGLIKITNESMMGIDIKLLSRFASSKSYLEKWFRMYPDLEHVIIDNSEENESFFIDYEDISTVC